MNAYRRHFIRLNMALVGTVLLVTLLLAGVYVARSEYANMRQTMLETLEPFRGEKGSFSYTPEAPEPPEPQEPQEAPEPVSRGRRVVRRSTKAAFQQLFSSHDEDELDLRYKPAQPAVDKAQAYNKPYYPPQWKPPADAGAPRSEQ